MKKTLLYITAILLLILTSAMCYAADTQLSANNAAEDLLEELKGKKKKIVAENLYLEIYKEVNAKPVENATKEMADKLGVSTAEVEKIVRTGDISSLLEAQKDVGLEGIQQQYMVIMQLYNNSLGTEILRNDLESKVSPSEIFADGDTSNSDFDLIHDLNIIEAILFNKSTPSEFGGKHPQIKINITSKEEKEALQGILNPQPPLTDADFEESLQEALLADISEQTGTNPLSCFDEDTSLWDALNDYNQQAEADEAMTTGELIEDFFSGEIPETATSETMPHAKPDDWPTKYLCPDAKFFCVTIDFVIKDVALGQYPKTANCVACHVNHINQILDTLNKKPLSPNKLTGSKMEMPKCKVGLTSIAPNMNVITVPMPPPFPENKDIFFKANIEEQWKKFNEIYRPLWYDKTKAQKETEEKEPVIPSFDDKAAKKALMDAPPNATLDDVQKRTAEIITTMNRELAENADTKSKETGETNEKHQMLINELSTMNTYFKTIKETIIKIKTPCTELSSKAKCS